MVKDTHIIRRKQATNCLSVFDHFVGLALKGLIFFDGMAYFEFVRANNNLGHLLGNILILNKKNKSFKNYYLSRTESKSFLYWSFLDALRMPFSHKHHTSYLKPSKINTFSIKTFFIFIHYFSLILLYFYLLIQFPFIYLWHSCAS